MKGTIFGRSYETQSRNVYIHFLIHSIIVEGKKKIEIVMFNTEKGNTVFISCHICLSSSWY